MELVNVKSLNPQATHVLATAHALVKLEDGTIVGDPMEKATLEALQWIVKSSDQVTPSEGSSVVATIRRRFQFSSALKRMSTVSTIGNGAKTLVSVKGAPETIKTMLSKVPVEYDDTYKWYTRRGSRVLALAYKELGTMSGDKVSAFKIHATTPN